jgi:hypothetical protein
MSCKHLCMQADLMEQVCIFVLLDRLFQELSCFVPAAIKGNVTPGLVTFLRKAHMDDGSRPENVYVISRGRGLALSCLKELMSYDMKHGKALWKTALDAGVVLG